MTISSIGTGGTYTTIQAWEDACPADITAAGTNEDWIGELKNQEFVITATITISGMVTDSTHRVILRCEAGASFRDHANKATNKLTYEPTYGAAIKVSVGYTKAFSCNSKHVTMQNFMLHNLGSGLITGYVNGSIDSCILIGNTLFDEHTYSNCTVKNSVIRTNAYSIDSLVTHINNTFIARTANSFYYGTKWYGSGSSFTNCLFLGYNDYPSASGYTMTNCGTTGTFANTTNSNCITGLTAATEIVAPAFGDSVVGNMDARLNAGASCISAGTSTGAPTIDIIGQTRA